ncbi:MAG: deoxyribonuclease IV [Gemmata sp.]
MPTFGAHLSIARGLHGAVASAVALGCGTLQVFTKNASQWRADPLSAGDAARFRRAVADAGLTHVTVHDSYLINLASPDDTIYKKSVAAFVDEMERAEALGASYLVTHPGAHTGSGDEAGLTRVVEGLDEAHARCPGFNVRVLIETTAGQGTALGHRFEHIATILQRARCAARMDVCFDTCHAFAAGYPLGTDDGYAATFQRFDELVGLSRLKVFHVNDSAKPLGSRVDRHAGIGLGEIGAGAFRRLVRDPRFADRPMILETPKKDDAGADLDAVNLARLRGYLTAAAAP